MPSIRNLFEATGIPILIQDIEQGDQVACLWSNGAGYSVWTADSSLEWPGHGTECRLVHRPKPLPTAPGSVLGSVGGSVIFTLTEGGRWFNALTRQFWSDDQVQTALDNETLFVILDGSTTQ